MTADTAWHKSACILCENNCGIQIQTDGRRFAKIRGDKEHVATAGYTCSKALRLDHYQNSGTRLTSPLRREADGTFTSIDWDTAIREIAARLKTVRDTHGGESIFFYGGGGSKATTSAAPTAAPCYAPSAPATAPTPSLRRRPARASSTPTSPADTPPVTSRTPKSPSSSARTPGSRTASHAPAPYSRTSPRIPTAP